MRYTRGFLLIIIFAFFSKLSGQSFEQELRNAISKKPTFEFKIDSRNSFISRTNARVVGFKVGIQYDHKLSFGLGYNQLWSNIERTSLIGGNFQNTNLKFHHFSPYTEYVFYRDDHWELSIPVQFGLGSTYQMIQGDENKKYNRKFVLSYEPAITFQYRFLKYCGAGLGIGYRLMLIDNPSIDEQFTSPVYLIKFRVYFEDLVNDLWHN